MKRSIFTTVVLVSLLALLVSVAAIPAKSISLAGLKFVDGKGVVVTFHTTGTYTDAELAGGFLYINHVYYGLHCAKQDTTHVDCQTPGSINKFHGYSAKGYLAGYGFTASIPKVTPHKAK